MATKVNYENRNEYQAFVTGYSQRHALEPSPALEVVNKKQIQRIVNLLLWLEGSTKLRCYTDIALKMLCAKGSVNQAELKQWYLDRGLAESTSKSQAFHYWKVFQVLGIATLKEGVLQLNQDSVFVRKYPR